MDRAKRIAERYKLPEDFVLRYIAAAQPGGVHRQLVALPAGAAPQILQDPDGTVHVPQRGTVLDLADAAAEYGGRQDRQDAVFRALHHKIAIERTPALHLDLVHMVPLRLS